MSTQSIQSCNDCGAILVDTSVCPQCGFPMPR